MKRSWDESDLIKDLNLLGTTTEEIAATLASEGIKGDHSCESCPIAQWLLHVCGWSCVAVETYEIEALYYDQGGISRRASTEHPQPILSFIRAFDAWVLDKPDLLVQLESADA